MRAAIILACALALSACKGDSGEPVKGAPQPGDVIAVPAFEWHVVSQAELEQVYRRSGMVIAEQQHLEGFVGRDPATGKTVVYTTAPRTVDDSATTTLGHEVLHVVLGDYHQ